MKPSLLALSFSLAAVASAGEPFTPFANLTAETWQLLDGGVDRDDRQGALLTFGAEADLQALADWSGWTAQATFFAYAGNRAADDFTGDFGGFSNLITDTEIALFTASLQRAFHHGHSRFRIGQLASDESFYIAEGGALFLNANFGALPSVSGNESAPVYSVGSAGVELKLGGERGYWQTALYAGEPGIGGGDDHGLRWKAGGPSGYLVFTEGAVNYAFDETRSGQLKLGAYHASSERGEFVSGRPVSSNHAFYAIVDQQLAAIGAAGFLSGFARYGYNPNANRSVVERYFDCGLNASGLIPSRPGDTFGIAYSNTRFSEAYRRDSAIQGQPVSAREQVIELTYHAAINERFAIQPSVQYIFNPHFGGSDALLIGLRVSKDI